MNIKLHNPGLVTFYDILPGMGMCLFLQLWSLYGGPNQTARFLILINSLIIKSINRTCWSSINTVL